MSTSRKHEASKNVRRIVRGAFLLALLALATFATNLGAQQPPPPCHPNPRADEDMDIVSDRGDVEHLPGPLKKRLVQMAGRPHSQLPTQAYAEAHFDRPPFRPKPSELFQYYLLDTTGFEPNPFTSLIRGVNDTRDAHGHRAGLRPPDHRGGARGAGAQARPADRSRTTCARSSTSSPTSPGCS